MNVPAKLEQRTSKAGSQYFCIVVNITDTVEKLVFLDKAELELIKLTHGKGLKLNAQE